MSTPGAAPRGTTVRDHRRRALDHEREPLPTRVEETPGLPAAYNDALEHGLARLGIELDAGARVAIAGHARLLGAWSGAMNLSGLRGPARVATGHVVDSLTALPVLRVRRIRRLLDLGSGAGYPGLPLSIALPAERALLVDSIGKKVRFMATVVAATGVGDRVEAVAARAEDLAADEAHRERWQAVLARAVGPLSELAELALPLLEPGGLLVAWKRGEIADELAAASRALTGLGGGSIESVDTSLDGLLAGHRLVLLTKAGPTPRTFPRDPAVRRRRPW